MSSKENLISYLDKAIVGFFILFLATVTNSIFLNQLGYGAAFILLVIKGFIQRKNPFSKTGLEWVLLFFITAELLSMAFSDNPSEAFRFFLKRLFLIPVLYTTVAAAYNFSKSKLYLKIYAAGAIITVIIYLIYSYQYIIYDLYSITGSGPSLFQYPITASEITSFTLIFLFAFLINERLSWKSKIWIFSGFVLSALALISTYKRTGWIGAAAGILIILIIKKKWKILIPGAALFVILLFIEKNKSEIVVFNYDDKTLVEEKRIPTDGRAYSVLIEKDYLYVSDYENGLAVYKGDSLLTAIEFPAPVISFNKWNDSLYTALLLDTRFILMKKKGSQLIKQDEFSSSGYTITSGAAGNNFYIYDNDSGLTVFTNMINDSDQSTAITNKHQVKRYTELAGLDYFSLDSSFMILASTEKGINLYPLKDDLPLSKIAVQNISGKLSSVDLYNGYLIASSDMSTHLFKLSETGVLRLDSTNEVSGIYKVFSSHDKLYFLTGKRELFECTLKDDKFNIISKNQINFTPYNTAADSNKIYLTSIKRSRLLSIFDPYLPSNYNRFALWEAGFKMFKDHPFFGVGDVDLAVYYKQYKHYYNKEIQGHLHNNLIHVLATLGLFGFLAVCLLLYRYIKLSFRIYTERKHVPVVSSFALAVIGSFFAFFFAGLTELNLWDHEIATFLWFFFGLNIALYNLTSNSRNSALHK